MPLSAACMATLFLVSLTGSLLSTTILLSSTSDLNERILTTAIFLAGVLMTAATALLCAAVGGDASVRSTSANSNESTDSANAFRPPRNLTVNLFAESAPQDQSRECPRRPRSADERRVMYHPAGVCVEGTDVCATGPSGANIHAAIHAGVTRAMQVIDNVTMGHTVKNGGMEVGLPVNLVNPVNPSQRQSV